MSTHINRVSYWFEVSNIYSWKEHLLIVGKVTAVLVLIPEKEADM